MTDWIYGHPAEWTQTIVKSDGKRSGPKCAFFAAGHENPCECSYSTKKSGREASVSKTDYLVCEWGRDCYRQELARYNALQLVVFPNPDDCPNDHLNAFQNGGSCIEAKLSCCHLRIPYQLKKASWTEAESHMNTDLNLSKNVVLIGIPTSTRKTPPQMVAHTRLRPWLPSSSPTRTIPDV